MKSLISVRHLRNLRPFSLQQPAAQEPDIHVQQIKRNTPPVKPSSASGKYETMKIAGDPKLLLTKAITPLAHLPYKEQLKWKSKKFQDIIRTMKDNFKETRASIQSNVISSTVVPSPVVAGYRNKDEFSVRYGLDGNETCGFFIGSASQNNLVCISPHHLLNVPETHKKVAQAFENYVRQSDWPVCEHFQKGGNWRIIQVRSNQKQELMATVIFHPQSLTASEIEAEMKNLKHYFYEGEGKFARLKTLYYQVNTRATEVLYRQVQDLAKIDRSSTLLDICCGTGTMGILMAPHVRQVVGIDNNVSAVEDARTNAKLNGVQNIKFYTGRAELMIKEIIMELDNVLDVVAVVNPGRSGLPNVVINVLRECDVINKVIYVSCHAEGPAQANFLQLCRSDFKSEGRRVKGPPFKLTKAIPVDMFPHTEHCELILSFER